MTEEERMANTSDVARVNVGKEIHLQLQERAEPMVSQRKA